MKNIIIKKYNDKPRGCLIDADCTNGADVKNKEKNNDISFIKLHKIII